MNAENLILGVVGVCGAGKSELVQRLRARGYKVKHIAQEHSYIKDMWQRISKPDILIYLDVSFEETMRRKKFDWSEKDYLEQQERVQHAYQHANLIVKTDGLSIEGVFDYVLQNLGDLGEF